MTECPELNTIYDAFESDLFKRQPSNSSPSSSSSSVNETQQFSVNNSTFSSPTYLSGQEEQSGLISTVWNSSTHNNQVEQMIDDEVTRRRKRTEDPLLVRIKVHGRRVGSKATFSCPPGYAVIGTEELVCLESGQWSSGMPSCQGM